MKHILSYLKGNHHDTNHWEESLWLVEHGVIFVEHHRGLPDILYILLFLAFVVGLG